LGSIHKEPDGEYHMLLSLEVSNRLQLSHFSSAVIRKIGERKIQDEDSVLKELSQDERDVLAALGVNLEEEWENPDFRYY
jgi:hypothetical protein